MSSCSEKLFSHEKFIKNMSTFAVFFKFKKFSDC